MDNFKEDQFPDELFRRKLEGHEIPASPDVWDRLGKGVKPAPLPIWQNRRLWAAAAVSGVLLGCGLWLGPDLGKGDQRHSGPVVQRNVSGSPHKPERTEGLSDEARLQVAELAADGKKEMIRAGSLNAGAKEPALSGSRKSEPVPSDRKAMVANAGNGNPVLAVRQSTLEEDSGSGISKSQSEVADSQTGARILVVYVTAPQPAEILRETAFDSTISVAAEEAAPEKKKRKGLQRFFRQLKNAKTGEKIDWDELGLTPQKVFANVDHTLEK